MQITLISHFFNESLLLPSFCLQWNRLVDNAVLIDYDSTDNSRAIIESLCPHWKIVPAKQNVFDAYGLDLHVMELESQFRGWKFAACSTEVLLHHDLRGFLTQWEAENPDIEAIGIRSAVLCQGPDEPTEFDPTRDLFQQRSFGFMDDGCSARPYRYLHRGVHGQYAQVGRHSTGLPWELSPDLILQWWGWSPWPQVKARKLQIQERIPQSNRLVGWGQQHIVTDAELDERYLSTLQWCGDLMENPLYADAVRKIRETHGL